MHPPVRTLRAVAAIWLLAIAPALLSGWIHPRRPAWNVDTLAAGEVSLAQVRNWRTAPLWIDARPRVDYEADHIPGALLLNEDEWDGLMAGVLAKWHPPVRIVVYCDSRECQASTHVAERLREDFRMSNVFVLHGGWSAWQEGSR